MKSALIINKENIIITDKPKPQIDRFNDTLIRVLYCGICGSDIPKYFGNRVKKYPLVLGHEICGIVEEGPSDLVGKLVAVKPMIYCDECEYCQQGQYQLCKSHAYLGSTIDGGMQEYICVPHKFVLDIDCLSSNPVMGVLVEPCAVAIHSIKKVIIKEDLFNKKIGIIGDGVIGLLVYKSLINYYDIDKNNIVLYNKNTDIIDNCCDYCFNCVGNVKGFNTSIKITKNNGTIILVGILYPEYIKTSKEDLLLDKILRKELNIVGSWNSNFTTNWKDSIRLLSTNMNEFSTLITNVYNLEDVNEAFRKKISNKGNKVIKVTIKVT